MKHRLEVIFKKQFSLEEVENLKDAIWEFLQEYEKEMGVEVGEVDLAVLDS